MNSNATSAGVNGQPQHQRAKLTQVLPTDRIAFSNQLDLLRAYHLAAPNGGSVTNDRIADIVQMTSSTASLANAFFVDVGFIARGDGGYSASQEVHDYAKAVEWGAESPGNELAPLLEHTWFGELLLPRVRMNPMSTAEARSTLGKASNSDPKKHRSRLSMLIDYLETAGLIIHEGGQIKATSSRVSTSPSDPSTVQSKEADPSPDNEEWRPEFRESPTPATGQHPFIQGLVQALPRVGTEWPLEKREAWTNAAKATFELIYDLPADERRGGEAL